MAKWRYLEQEEALVCEELGMRISLMKGFLYKGDKWGLFLEEEGKEPVFLPVGTEEEARAFFLRGIKEWKEKGEVEA